MHPLSALLALGGAPALAQPQQVPAPQEYTRQLFSAFPERIIEVEEHRSGPGFPVLTHVTLYERPATASAAGLCQARTHTVFLPVAQPPADTPRQAVAVDSSTRFYMIDAVGPGLRPAGQAARCAALTNLRDFFEASESDV